MARRSLVRENQPFARCRFVLARFPSVLLLFAARVLMLLGALVSQTSCPAAPDGQAQVSTFEQTSGNAEVKLNLKE
jgi:hypothetical protein